MTQYLVRCLVEEERDVYDAKYGTWRTARKDCEEGFLVEASCPETASELARKTHHAKEILAVQIHCE